VNYLCSGKGLYIQGISPALDKVKSFEELAQTGARRTLALHGNRATTQGRGSNFYQPARRPRPPVQPLRRNIVSKNLLTVSVAGLAFPGQ
jgi:hypothetical protein